MLSTTSIRGRRVLALLFCQLVSCSFTTGNLIVHVSKDATFQWNSTELVQAKWIMLGSNHDVSIVYKINSLIRVNPSYQGRASFVGDLKKGWAWFKLSNLLMNDTSNYVAEIVKSSNMQETIKSTQLFLQVTDTPTFTTKPKTTTTVVEKKTFTITCVASGQPPPSVTMRNANHAIVDRGTGSAVYTAYNTKRDQNGTKFKCMATNNPNEDPITVETTIIVYYPPEFTRSPDDKTVKEGGTVTLHCQATANPLAVISWKKEHKAGFLTHSSDGTLTINNAEKSDAGKYICIARNDFNNQKHNATSAAIITVKYQPTIYYNSSKHVVIENGTVTMRCKADGYPKPKITWSKSGSSGTPNTGEWYNISSVNRSDAGTYTCTASNGIGNTATADIQVTVQYKPTINTGASNTTGSSWNGHSITLSCTIKESFPLPTWTWYKPNGTTFTDNVARTSSITLTTGHQQNDYGLYKCKAENVAGSDVHQINVTQLFSPGPPNVTVTNIEAASVTVRWTKPAYDGGSPVTGYKLEINSKPYGNEEPKMEDTVGGLTKDTQYEVKLYARNVVGYGNAANTTFRTRKLGPPAQPIITDVVVSQTSVTLTWLKPANNGGKITGYTIYKKVKDQDIKWKQIAQISGAPVTYTLENLERGKTYLLIVSATNEFGESVKEDSKAKNATIPTLPITLAPGGPSKGQSSGGDDPNQTIIIVGVVVAVILILITAVISIIILRKKNIFGQGTRKSGRNESAAYHNDVDTNDSLGRQAAVINLNGNDDIPTYAAVDMSKKTKKKTNDIPTYAAVDKSKKKRPGEIIYAELADFNTNNTAATPRPDQYAGTDYADISQFQQQSEPEPTYANFQGRSKDYANVEDMSSQA